MGVKGTTSKYTDVQHMSWKITIMPSCEISKRNQSALMRRIRSPGTLWKSNNRFCICSFFHLMISTSLLLSLIIGNVAVGGTTIPIENVEDDFPLYQAQNFIDPRYQRAIPPDML